MSTAFNNLPINAYSVPSSPSTHDCTLLSGQRQTLLKCLISCDIILWSKLNNSIYLDVLAIVCGQNVKCDFTQVCHYKMSRYTGSRESAGVLVLQVLIGGPRAPSSLEQCVDSSMYIPIRNNVLIRSYNCGQSSSELIR